MFDVSPGSFFWKIFSFVGQQFIKSFCSNEVKFLLVRNFSTEKSKREVIKELCLKKNFEWIKLQEMTSWWKKSENMTVETSTLKTPSRNRDNTHTQNMNPRFYISIFFHHNDTVVDAQIFKIFEHHQSILYVFLGQNLLICSSPARILLCKFLKELLFAQNSLSFKQNTSNFQYLSIFWFLRLHYTTCFGNLEEMTHNLNLRNIIFFTF